MSLKFSRDMTEAFLTCVAFCNHPEDESHPGQFVNHRKFTPKAWIVARQVCDRFIEAAGTRAVGLSAEDLGHNLYYTAAGHGTGFWDRGLGQQGEDLTELCRHEFACIEHAHIYIDDNDCYEIEGMDVK